MKKGRTKLDLKAPTSVFWDIDKCPVPAGSDAHQVYPCIKRFLRNAGYSGPLSITAVGKLTNVPRDVLRALSSTGIHLTHTESRHHSVFGLLFAWSVDVDLPANVMVISTKKRDHPGFGILSGYGLNLIYDFPYTTFKVPGPLEEEDKCSDTGGWKCILCYDLTGLGAESLIKHFSSREHKQLLRECLPYRGCTIHCLEAPPLDSATLVEAPPLDSATLVEATPLDSATLVEATTPLDSTTLVEAPTLDCTTLVEAPTLDSTMVKKQPKAKASFKKMKKRCTLVVDHEAPTSVFWDIDKCPVPSGSDAHQVYPCIKRFLRNAGYSGPLSITAVGKLTNVPRDLLRALSSTGIHLTHTVSRHRNAVAQLFAWGTDFFFGKRWGTIVDLPANVMVISTEPLYCLSVDILSDGFGLNIIYGFPHTTFKVPGPLEEEDKCSDTGEWKCTVCYDLTGLDAESLIKHFSSREHAQNLWDHLPYGGCSIHCVDTRLDSTKVKKQPKAKKKNSGFYLKTKTFWKYKKNRKYKKLRT